MTHVLVRKVREGLRDAANPAKAPGMQAYMKPDMPFRGVSAPEQKRLWRTVFAEIPLETFGEWQKLPSVRLVPTPKASCYLVAVGSWRKQHVGSWELSLGVGS